MVGAAARRLRPDGVQALITSFTAGASRAPDSRGCRPICGASVIAGKGFELRLGSDDVPQTLVLAVLGVGVWTVFGLGLGTLIRNQVAAILVAIGVTVLLDPLITLGLGALDLGSVARFLPSSASQAVVQGVSTNDSIDLLPWWGGLLVLLAYGGCSRHSVRR